MVDDMIPRHLLTAKMPMRQAGYSTDHYTHCVNTRGSTEVTVTKQSMRSKHEGGGSVLYVVLVKATMALVKTQKKTNHSIVNDQIVS